MILEATVFAVGVGIGLAVENNREERDNMLWRLHPRDVSQPVHDYDATDRSTVLQKQHSIVDTETLMRVTQLSDTASPRALSPSASSSKVSESSSAEPPSAESSSSSTRAAVA